MLEDYKMTEFETLLSKLEDAQAPLQAVLDAWSAFADAGKSRDSDADFQNFITVAKDASTRALALIQSRETEMSAR